MPPPTPRLPGPTAVPGHDALVAFFGVRLRLVAGIVAVGTAGGLIGAGYLWLLEATTAVLGPDRWEPAVHVAVLVAVGGAVAGLVRVLGHPAGVELVVDNIHVPDGDRTARLRSLLPVSLLCIGAGGTLGPEAPLVTTTGTLAHRVGRRAGLAPGDVRVVMIAGMAAGFAVLFGAPLGSALFALEIPHRRGIQYHEAVIPACIGAVLGFGCSTAAGRMGLAPIWDLPPVVELEWIDLGWSVLAGLTGALIAALFTVAATLAIRLVGLVPASLRPPLGGLVLGGIGLSTPFILTNGEFQIEELTVGVAAGALAVAMVAKFGGAVIAVATGWRGGFIIPLMFIGFCAGRLIAPHLPGATEWAFVVSAMIAANVGVTKTPLGSTLVVLEMAGMTVLPSALVAALTSMIVTNPLAMIDAQRERVDVYGAADDR